MLTSLEIVNIYLEVLELEECKEILLYRDYIQQIKQDLEVLGIIKYKIVNIEALKFCLEQYDNDNKALEIYNYFEEDYRKLTMEELLKLKQWLETNKAGDSNE